MAAGDSGHSGECHQLIVQPYRLVSRWRAGPGPVRPWRLDACRMHRSGGPQPSRRAAFGGGEGQLRAGGQVSEGRQGSRVPAVDFWGRRAGWHEHGAHRPGGRKPSPGGHGPGRRSVERWAGGGTLRGRARVMCQVTGVRRSPAGSAQVSGRVPSPRRRRLPGREARSRPPASWGRRGGRHRGGFRRASRWRRPALRGSFPRIRRALPTVRTNERSRAGAGAVRAPGTGSVLGRKYARLRPSASTL